MLTIKFSNKTAYTIIAVVILLAVIGISYAAVNKNQAWHASQQVEITVAGESMSLQEAIDQGKLGGVKKCEKIAEATGRTGIKVSVPDYCKNGKICYLLLKDTIASSVRGTRGTFYTQDANGYWNIYMSYWSNTALQDLKNGDMSYKPILSDLQDSSADIIVWDDYVAVSAWNLAAENSPDSWVLYNNFPNAVAQLYACPAYEF